MARSIDYRSSSGHSAADVYATMTDPEYITARLEQIGGPGAALLDHSADVERARYTVRHGLTTRDMPSIVRNVLPGDIVIERAERWSRRAPGHYTGDVDVTIRGTPASADGGMRLQDLASGGSEFVVHAVASVRVPLIGGKIEGVIADQVRQLLAAETAFTLEWLRTR